MQPEVVEAPAVPHGALAVGLGVAGTVKTLSSVVGLIRITVIVSSPCWPWGRVGPISASNTPA